MSAILRKPVFDLVINEIETHSAWKGRMSGLKAEKMLRNQNTPYLYILRKGETESETETDYYVSFVLPDLSVKHQPFVITIAPEGWYYENQGVGGPFTDAVSIDDVLYLIMHCDKGTNKPLAQ
jgi:hypothetical protein